jgi:Na+-transporting methylmalonyl-CoA/oxaloacetate decarboxylase gamma subunit
MGLLLIVLLLLVLVPAVLYLIGWFINRIRVPGSRENDIRKLAFNQPEATLDHEVTPPESVEKSKELQEAQAEIMRLRKQLQRVEEERDTLMKTSR